MSYKLYMVVGAESSGTRLVTNLLIEAGCFGDSSHEQRLDTYEGLWGYDFAQKVVVKQFPMVWRRSFPHGNEWPVLDDMIRPFMHFGLVREAEILFLVTVRNWYCASKSAVRMGHGGIKNENLHIARFEKAYRSIFGQLSGSLLKNYLISYDELVARPYFALQQIYKAAQLEVDPSRLQGIAASVRDENNKWYFGG